MNSKSDLPDQPILLFDGICNMCNSLVQFVIKRDKKEQIYFASLQSEAGQRLLQEVGLENISMDSFVYIDSTKALIKSAAAFMVFRKLGGLWKVLYIGMLVPRAIRDWGYQQIAKRRYSWFGKKEECMIPTPQQRRRFLESVEDIARLAKKD